MCLPESDEEPGRQNHDQAGRPGNRPSIDRSAHVASWLDRLTSVAEIDAISEEVRKVNQRVTAVGALVLADQTAAMRSAAAAVQAAIPEVSRAIDEVEAFASAAHLLASVLSLVDTFVGTAKLLG